jgi:hypothetical protein
MANTGFSLHRPRVADTARQQTCARYRCICAQQTCAQYSCICAQQTCARASTESALLRSALPCSVLTPLFSVITSPAPCSRPSAPWSRPPCSLVTPPALCSRPSFLWSRPLLRGHVPLLRAHSAHVPLLRAHVLHVPSAPCTCSWARRRPPTRTRAWTSRPHTATPALASAPRCAAAARARDARARDARQEGPAPPRLSSPPPLLPILRRVAADAGRAA